MLGQHLESEAKKGGEIHIENLDSLPAGLGEVYAVNFERAFPEGREDPEWTEAKPLVELIAADHGGNGGGAPSVGRWAAGARA